MRIPYLQRIKEGIIIFDGAMGTLLYEKGFFVNRCYEELNLRNPDVIKEIHARYIEAGAEVLESNTFGANEWKLNQFGHDQDLEDINRQAVRLAREVAGDDNYVAGAVGPIGQSLEPIGRLKKSRAKEIFSRQLTVLLQEDIDLILFETFKDINELLLAIEVCREMDKNIPIQAQFTFFPQNYAKNSKRVQHMMKKLDLESGANVIGINCSIGPADTLDIMLQVTGIVNKPLAVMPNAGYPKEVEGRLLYLATPEYFATYGRRFIEIGVSVIGGCCGTTPAHIKEISRSLTSHDINKTRPEITYKKEEIEKKPQVPLEDRSQLGKALVNSSWINLVELVPPLGVSLKKTLEKAKTLKEYGITAINLPDGPRASARVSGLITAIELERESGIETVIHYCCRDRNLIGMQSDLLGAHVAGIRNLLIVTGDPPKLGGYTDATGVFDIDSIGLTSFTRNLNQGIDMGGNPLSSPTAFTLGVGANPTMLDIETEIERTYKKKEAGADYVITQPVFDVEKLLYFLDRVKETELPVIAGIWPLYSYKNAQFLNNEIPGVDIPEHIMKKMEKARDKGEGIQFGIETAIDIVKKIHKNIQGIQLSPPFGNLGIATRMLDEIKEKVLV